jgi:ribonuclease HII
MQMEAGMLGKRSRDDKVIYRSLLKPSPHVIVLSTTKDDPRAELRYVLKRSWLERQLSRIDDESRVGVERLAQLFEKVQKDSLYDRFAKDYELEEEEYAFGYSTNPKRELEFWDHWYYKQTGKEWKGKGPNS